MYFGAFLEASLWLSAEVSSSNRVFKGTFGNTVPFMVWLNDIRIG
jgi:hypothetical protein